MSDQGAASWPDTVSSARPSEGWTNRSVMDLEGSQFSWFHAGLAADELELACRVMSEPVAGAEHEGQRHAALAEALVLLGRATEARRLLEAEGVSPPVPGSQVDWRQVLLGASYAATGDATAWRWLTARLSDVATEWRLRLTRVVAAVADQRGDLAVADEAWADVPTLSGTSSPRLAQRTALAGVLHRNREASANSILQVVFGAYGTLRAVAVEDAPTRDAVLATAGALEVRGDRAGARLLLRSAAGMLPRDASIRAALRRLRPAASRGVVLRLVGSALAVLAAVTFVVVRGTSSPETLGTDIRTTGLALVGVLGVAMRLSPLAGFTMPETTAWRGLRSLRFDPMEGPRGGAGGSGWLGVAGIVGAVVTFATIAVVLSTLTPTGTWPLWAVTGSAMVLWLVMTATGAAGAVLVMRQVRLVVGRRRVARARAEARKQADRRAAVCACWDVFSTWGPDAQRYVERHLAVPGPTVPVAVPDAQLRLCPTTGLPWLVGPIGEHGRFLAIKGALRDVDDSAAEGAPAPTGLYL